MVVYECGNWDNDEEPDECPLCGAEQRDEQPEPYSTVSVTCPGWYEDGEEP